MNFSIKPIIPHVYHLHFETAYDVAMHFIRFQEYYESPKFHKKPFTMSEYMRWYSMKYGEGAFTYPKDWSGFNVPSWALIEVRNITPFNEMREEDILMCSVIDRVRKTEEDHPFYFIGTSAEGYKGDGDEKGVLQHELAHALCYVDSEYRAQVSIRFQEWFDTGGGWDKVDVKNIGEMGRAEATLQVMGYHPSTVRDELHAYCATGLCDELKKEVPIKRTLPFQKLFQETIAGLEVPK